MYESDEDFAFSCVSMRDICMQLIAQIIKCYTDRNTKSDEHFFFSLYVLHI